ncbi:MAG: esterase/lipase family protein, partial [Cyanobium sp.]
MRRPRQGKVGQGCHGLRQAPHAAPERHLSSAAAAAAPAATATAAAGSPQACPPLVLVHGLFDTPRLFHGLRARLAPRRSAVLAPHLPHALGSVPLESLAADLDRHITAAFGPDQPIDLLGFSMGGVIGRT